jgi:hypothetical protein
LIKVEVSAQRSVVQPEGLANKARSNPIGWRARRRLQPYTGMESRNMQTSQSRDRRGPAVLAMLVVGALLSAIGFLGVRHLYAVGTEEGAAAGWWWCLSFSWLLAALEKPADGDLASLIGRPAARAAQWLFPMDAQRPVSSSPPVPMVRWYLLASFSLFGVLETVQQGAPAAVGFLVGAGAFALLFTIAECGVLLIQTRGKPRAPFNAQLI